MPEQQNIEYKQSWHDDYLKWICGFANAIGGTIYIGVDDQGTTIGVEDYKRLMDDIPNKVKNSMGINVEVNLLQSRNLFVIQINTPPYSVPISLRGRYYYRSGSTKQELTGASLNDFLLKKSGHTWDDAIEPRASINDIDSNAVSKYLSIAEKSGRLPNSEILSTDEILTKLRLSENGQIKRAAIILFGKDPGKFYPNTFVKIGRFGEDATDLKFQEVEDGCLMNLVDNVLQQLDHKFLTRSVEFQGVQRIEKSTYPITAMREMLLNALVHRNYMGAPTQIRVADNSISIWNEGTLPQGLTLEALKRTHSSIPRNPIIADVCFKGGYIDSWGRGTLKIVDSCIENHLPEPQMNEIDGGFSVTLYKANSTSEPEHFTSNLNERQRKSIAFVKKAGRINNSEYQLLNNCSRPTAQRDLADLTKKGVLEYSNTKGAGAFYWLKNKQS